MVYSTILLSMKYQAYWFKQLNIAQMKLLYRLFMKIVFQVFGWHLLLLRPDIYCSALILIPNPVLHCTILYLKYCILQETSVCTIVWNCKLFFFFSYFIAPLFYPHGLEWTSSQNIWKINKNTLVKIIIGFNFNGKFINI